MTGERRMGKTSIVRDKMRNAPSAGYKIVYMDVSGCDTPLAFVDTLFHEAKESLSAKAKVKFGAMELVRRLLPNAEIGQMVKLPDTLAPQWKEMLRAVLTDFADSETKYVLTFDEMPIMLDKIRRGMGESAAMDVLDTLRKERQHESRLRMIYTGSLGLHHVLGALQEADYHNEPTNDLKFVEVGPLSEADATELARRLLSGMEIPCTNAELLAKHLADITDGMPYYIQNLVSELADYGETCDLNIADRLLTVRLTDLSDPWDFGYYKSRIGTHYPDSVQAVAMAFLNQLAVAETSQTLDDLLDGLDPNKVVADDDAIERTLDLLGKDRYIAQGEDGAYRFRYPLIARAWRYRSPLSARGKRGRA